MKLTDLRPAPGATKPNKRRGRGQGSGNGSTAGRGAKGHRARAGNPEAIWFEGGQMPLQRRLPKFGFHNHGRVEYQPVNVCDLSRFDAGTEVTPELLHESRLARKKTMKVKLLGHGEIDRALKVKVHAASESARKKIEAAGGSVEIVGTTQN
ncbi:MAG: 50S ribosomal protein L15 [Candidatus Eisenbacteria bacterium]|uniref:Large ribosomal subunit protein uL15 n=1 Tax=Eiseniibacteriota bacterium TaxID=2212470 RepID=A0A956LXV0_UNCEI|nr:50S ribosomal protein L15 [Candidatus Eisenbacteria bacterium]